MLYIFNALRVSFATPIRPHLTEKGYNSVLKRSACDLPKTETMNDDITIIFNGFLNLPNLDKLKLVEAINEYFDANEREPIRKANDEKFAELDLTERTCCCCGR